MNSIKVQFLLLALAAARDVDLCDTSPEGCPANIDADPNTLLQSRISTSNYAEDDATLVEKMAQNKSTYASEVLVEGDVQRVQEEATECARRRSYGYCSTRRRSTGCARRRSYGYCSIRRRLTPVNLSPSSTTTTTTGEKAWPWYWQSTSGGTCPTGQRITTKTQCEQAAARIGHSPQMVNHEGAYGHIPAGCAVRAGELIWSTSSASNMHGGYSALCKAACPVGYKETSKNLDGAGKQFRIGGTVEGCGTICKQRSGCTSFEFNKAGNEGYKCATYTGGQSNVQSGSQSSQWQSCIEAACPVGYEKTSNHLNGAGQQVSANPDRTVEGCASICNQRPGCTSFLYNEAGNEGYKCATYTGGQSNVQSGSQYNTWQSCLKATCALYICSTQGWDKKDGVDAMTTPNEAKCCEACKDKGATVRDYRGAPSCATYAMMVGRGIDWTVNGQKGIYCEMGKSRTVRRRAYGGDAKDNCRRTCGYCQA